MGAKLMWGGLTLIVGLSELDYHFPWKLLGGLVMIVGYVLYLLDK